MTLNNFLYSKKMENHLFILRFFDKLHLNQHLDYENRQNVNNGYCDMWKTEGYQTVRVDSEGHVFSFQEGMVFVFDQKKNMHTDYTSVGTH